MKTSPFAALLIIAVACTAAAWLLISQRPAQQATALVCPAAQGGCYLPPPSIGRLMP
jgi:hypothetical protein